MDWAKTVKIVAVPTLAAALLTGGYQLSKPPLMANAAAPGTPQTSTDGASQIKGSIYLDPDTKDCGKETGKEEAQQGKEENERAEAAQLAAKAKISTAEAQAKAVAAHPGMVVKQINLGSENGYLVYEVEMQGQTQEELDVKVDAGNGTVLATESDQESPADETHAQTPDTDQVEEQVEQ